MSSPLPHRELRTN